MIEAGKPLQELAERCDTLGIPLRESGEICVDNCCLFRYALQSALPGIHVVQDCMHLESRIISTIAKDSPLKGKVINELSRALIREPSDAKGKPALYWSAQEQVNNLKSLWEKYKPLGNVWTAKSETVFKSQIFHAGQKCLQRRHPSIPSHTSGNENWHARLNGLTKGDASSLTTVVALLADGVLRFNLKVKIYGYTQKADSPSRQFRSATKGCHHLFLIEDVLRLREILYETPQPEFLNIRPEHHFGLVQLNAG